MSQATTLNSKQIKRTAQAIKLRKYAVRDLTIFYFGLYSGLRAKELASLRVSNVYTEDGAVRDTFVLQKEQTKGNKTRIVYISTALQKTLISYKQSLSNFTYDSYLFNTRKSKCFSANTMSQLFLNIFKSAQLDDASSHSMRRTFITELAHKGINVRVLQQLAGHSDIGTTQRYIDYNDKQLSNAVELMTL
ncbi:site-specific integrase [Burkholderiales bacterium]|nr:site-specific integrase [Burkholderiales bacterium]